MPRVPPAGPLRATRRALTRGVVIGLALAGAAAHAGAQIRGTRPVATDPDYGWWFSGGVNGAVMADVLDGWSNTRWRFGSDPLWQFRGTLERALDDNTTFGLAAGYGAVDVSVSPLESTTGGGTGLGPGCGGGCTAQTQLWSAMGQLRSGGSRRGFGRVAVLSGGVTGFRDWRVKGSGDPISGLSRRTTTDLTGTIGGGFTYALGRGTAIELIQDFGIAWHSKEQLGDGQSRTYRSRTTRAGLRFQFGGNQ